MTGTNETRKKLFMSLAWLKELADFCDQILHFVSLVGEDADVESFVTVPDWVRAHPGLQTLALPSSHWRVNYDIQSGICMPAIMYVHNQSRQVFCALRAHPVLGKFRPNLPSLFYDKPLGIAMSLAIQHDIGPVLNNSFPNPTLVEGWTLCKAGQEEIMCNILGIKI
jgi:hypothetical protein